MKSTRLALIVGAFAALIASSLTLNAITITGVFSANQRQIDWVGIQAITREEAITATASGSITTSYQLTAGISRVSTVASSGDGVKLPSISQPGLTSTNVNGSLVMVLINAGANSMNVFPQLSTETINAGSAGAAYAVAAGKTATCYVGTSAKWYCSVSA